MRARGGADQLFSFVLLPGILLRRGGVSLLLSALILLRLVGHQVLVLGLGLHHLLCQEPLLVLLVVEYLLRVSDPEEGLVVLKLGRLTQILVLACLLALLRLEGVDLVVRAVSPLLSEGHSTSVAGTDHDVGLPLV